MKEERAHRTTNTILTLTGIAYMSYRRCCLLIVISVTHHFRHERAVTEMTRVISERLILAN